LITTIFSKCPVILFYIMSWNVLINKMSLHWTTIHTCTQSVIVIVNCKIILTNKLHILNYYRYCDTLFDHLEQNWYSFDIYFFPYFIFRLQGFVTAIFWYSMTNRSVRFWLYGNWNFATKLNHSKFKKHRLQKLTFVK